MDDVHAEISAILDAATDPDRVRHDALRRCSHMFAVNQQRPGTSPADQSLDARWARALEIDAEAVLGAMRVHPEPSVRQYGNGKEWAIVLPHGAGELIVKFSPGKAVRP